MSITTLGSATALITPVEIARALGQPEPTPEQAQIISAPGGPALVVAGAGSGKTETMAARVVWLIVNRKVRPEEILGLTFTRKAAQELTARIRRRLAQLAGAESLIRRIDVDGSLRTLLRTGEPEVSTYHAYAGRLLSEYGLLLPVEPSAMLLGETELWQLAHQVVSRWDSDLETESSPSTITRAVVALSGELAEHLVDLGALERAHDELATLVNTLPAGPGQREAPNQALLDVVAAQERRAALLPLVRALRETLRREGALDYGQQMSLAAQVARDHVAVGEGEHRRFRAVLLDEYQDTGYAQRVLLRALFGAGADVTVTAVGDPMQSIYGWRGASAANLPLFARDFPLPDGRPAPRYELLTSWRNPARALQVANAVSGPLRERGVPVSPLRPRQDATDGDIRMALLPDVVAEREWVAERIAERYEAAREAGHTPPSAAVLVRRNADAAPVAEALRAKGIPVEVAGLGGLLDEPEVRDIVSVLRLIADPMAGSAAMRILTGARWQLGAADLAALSRRARELAVVGGYGVAGAVEDAATLDDALGSALPGDSAEQAGLADALADPGPPERYSAEGYRRISAVRRELADLRERLGQPLTELVAEVERSLGVGIEAVARRHYRGHASDTQSAPVAGVGRERLDAFADVVAGYAANPNATLSGFLSYLQAAEDVEDGLDLGEVEAPPDCVEVVSVHASKGREWDVVAIPHLVSGVFPSETSTGTWLGDVTKLPPSLRGDGVAALAGSDGVFGGSAGAATADAADPADPALADAFPELVLDDCHNRKDVQQAIDRHKKVLAARRLDEERRLFYVALTRTKDALLLSGHHWPEAGKCKGPSKFLTEVADRLAECREPEPGAEPSAATETGGAEQHPLGARDPWAPEPDEADNPLAARRRSAQWPADPLGERRGAVEDGAALVRAALRETAELTDDDPEGWAADATVLLAERAARRAQRLEVPLPQHLSVSQLVQLGADPDALAERLRRPVPYPPNPLARRGTAFHAWVERRFGATRLLDLDELPGADETGAGPDTDVTELQEAFLRSAWAHRTPVDVEVPFETVVGETVLRGRMDAVFRDPDGGWTVVDWKTGAEPGPEEQRSVVLQLAAYRIAWSRLAGAEPVPLERVRAAFHYVRTGRTIVPDDLPGPDDLARLIGSAGARDAK